MSALVIDESLAGLSVAPPTPTAESLPWWQALRAGRLTVQTCGACGTAQGYPRTRCVRCWSGDLALAPASGRAELVAHSEVHRPGQSSWAAIAPYRVGLVRLAEGATLLTHLRADALPEGREPRVGDACEVSLVRIGAWVLPFFRVLPGGTASTETTGITESTERRSDG